MTTTLYRDIALQLDSAPGDTFLITPVTGEVSPVDTYLGDYSDCLYWEGADGITWPESIDYRSKFTLRETITPVSCQHHLESFVEQGTPFYVQTVTILDTTSPDSDTPVGWALLVKVLESAEIAT